MKGKLKNIFSHVLIICAIGLYGSCATPELESGADPGDLDYQYYDDYDYYDGGYYTDESWAEAEDDWFYDYYDLEYDYADDIDKDLYDEYLYDYYDEGLDYEAESF